MLNVVKQRIIKVIILLITNLLKIIIADKNYNTECYLFSDLCSNPYVIRTSRPDFVCTLHTVHVHSVCVGVCGCGII